MALAFNVEVLSSISVTEVVILFSLDLNYSFNCSKVYSEDPIVSWISLISLIIDIKVKTEGQNIIVSAKAEKKVNKYSYYDSQ